MTVGDKKMAEAKENTTEEKPAEDKKTTKKATKREKNTMKIQLINSAETEINITGPCSDKEVKAICRAISHTPDQKVEVKKLA